MARNLEEPGANFNQLLELSLKLQNARTFAGSVALADESYNWQQGDWTDPDDESVGNIKILEDFVITDEMRRKPNAAGGRIYGGYAQQIADGGRAGYKDGETVLPQKKPWVPSDFKGGEPPPKNLWFLKKLLSQEAWNTLGARTWTNLTFDYAKKAHEAGQISDATYKNLMMPLFGEKGEQLTEAIAKHDELNKGGRVGLKYGTFNPDPMKELEEKMRVDYNLEVIEVLKRGEKPTPFIDWVSDNIGRYKSD